jgi:hypothetical protein
MACADTLTSVPISCINQVFDSANCSVGNIPAGSTMSIPVPGTNYKIPIANDRMNISELPNSNWGKFKTALNAVIAKNADLCAASITGNISEIVTNIANLQTTEQTLINELDSYTSKSGGYVATDPIIIGLVTKINAIADARIAMFKTISANANILQTGVSQSRVDLVSQMTLLQVVEDQLNAAKEKIQQLNNKNDTQMRLVEINTYYGQRYEAQGGLMQKIIMVCIPLLILFILKKKGILPEMIANYVIGIVIALGTIYILYNVWDIFVRSNMDFNTYDWAYEQPEGQVPSIWEYNKKNMFNFDGILKNLMTNLGVCIGEQCCAPGLTYDNTRMQCVKPPLAQKTVSPFTTMGNLQGTVLRNTDALNDEIIGVAPFSHELAFASVA